MDRLTKLVDGEWLENHDNDTRKWKNGNRECMTKLAAYEDTGLTPEEVPQWVSADERLPDTGTYDDWRTHVLLCAEKRVLEGFLNEWGTWSRANGANTKDLPPITHWMPLPTPPKED